MGQLTVTEFTKKYWEKKGIMDMDRVCISQMGDRGYDCDDTDKLYTSDG